MNAYSSEQFYTDAKASFKSCYSESEIKADLSSAGLDLNVRINDINVGLSTVEIYGTK